MSFDPLFFGTMTSHALGTADKLSRAFTAMLPPRPISAKPALASTREVMLGRLSKRTCRHIMGNIAILAAGTTLPYGPAAVADTSEEIALNVEALIHGGNIDEARAKLAQLIGTPPLSEKIADYTALLDTVEEAFSHHRRLELASEPGLPELSGLEQRALYWLATLKPAGVTDGDCRVDGPESLLHLSAANGLASSQLHIGTMLDSGAGCWSQDHEAAVYWFTSAAEQGNSDARVSLAIALALGRGAQQDDASALELLLQSAEEENARAQFLVGIRFLGFVRKVGCANFPYVAAA